MREAGQPEEAIHGFEAALAHVRSGETDADAERRAGARTGVPSLEELPEAPIRHWPSRAWRSSS